MNYAGLIAEAELYANDDGIMGMPASPNAKMCDMICRLTAALRELAPPEGWRVTEWTRADGAWCRQEDREWTAGQETDLQLYDPHTDAAMTFPTASAAMAALDGESKS